MYAPLGCEGCRGTSPPSHRSHYTSAIETAKEVLKNTFTVDGKLTVPPINACLPAKVNDITMHFSFDMAQQVCSHFNVPSTYM
jgi:hypothetical protein